MTNYKSKNAAASDPAERLERGWFNIGEFVRTRLGAHNPDDVISVEVPDTDGSLEVKQIPSRYGTGTERWRTLVVRAGSEAVTFHQTSSREAMRVPSDEAAVWDLGDEEMLREMAVGLEGLVWAIQHHPERVKVNGMHLPGYR